MNSLPADPNELAARLASLLGEERSVLVEFLRHLERFDAEKGYAPFACSSTFVYCTERLRLSKSAAYRRITAARLMRRFPVIGEFLADGRLCLTRICMLNDVLTFENHADLLQRAAAGSEEDVELLVASLRPKPAVADSIRKLPERRTTADATGAEAVSAFPGSSSGAEPIRSSAAAGAMAPAAAASTCAAFEHGSGAELAAHNASPEAMAALAPITQRDAGDAGRSSRPTRMDVEPLSGATHLVRMTVDRAFLDEFEAVRAALSHKIQDGNFEDVLRECFRITLEVCERRRCGSERRAKTTHDTQRVVEQEPANAESGVRPASLATGVPEDDAASVDASESDRAPSSRYIPVKVRRAVWKRDGGRCAFVSADGKRCGSNWQVDFHHCDPYATGGPPTVKNLSLRCRTHNRYEADVAFGPAFMRKRVTEARSRRSSSVPPRNQRGLFPSGSTDDAPASPESSRPVWLG